MLYLARNQAAGSASLSGRDRVPASLERIRLRSTPLTRPVKPSRRAARTCLTASSTAAWSGTLSMNRIWAAAMCSMSFTTGSGRWSMNLPSMCSMYSRFSTAL